MDNNFVRLVGTVKQSAENVSGRLQFTVEVPDAKGDKYWFDCICTRHSAAFAALDGFVNAGEPIEVIGHLTKNTTTEHGKVGNTRIETKTTNIVIYVDEVETEEE